MIMDGKSIKKEILLELKEIVNEISVKPTLVVVQVGDDEASDVYIRQKANMAKNIGYGYKHIKLGNDVSMDSMLELIDGLNNDNDVHGILVQMPLPKQLDASVIQNAIKPSKDVDGLSDVNAGMLSHNRDTLYPCTPYGVMELLKRYNIDIEGKNAVVVGRSVLVGKPMATMLLNEGATVTVCHSKTKDLSFYTKNADILVVAVGKAKFITADMVKEDSVIIDVGINRLEDGLCGDVDFDNVRDKVNYITPVPGGVGQLTVAMLAKNVLKAYKMQK